MATYRFAVSWTEGALVEVETDSEDAAFDMVNGLGCSAITGPAGELPPGVTVAHNDGIDDWTVEPLEEGPC